MPVRVRHLGRSFYSQYGGLIISQIKTIGIIGLGSFGRFMASLVPQDKNIVIQAYDPKAVPMSGVELTDLETVAVADLVALAIPLEAYPKILKKLAGLIKPETLLMDVCSVKVYPEKYFDQYFPDHPNMLLTHPLFGSQSASDTTAGHKLVVTKSRGEKAEELLAFCEQDLDLELRVMSGDEHDKIMAQIHVLTFFVARGLSSVHVKKVPFMTPSYKMITDLVAFDQTHSDELFYTIQSGNPYAEEMRQQVVKSFAQLESLLAKEKK